MDQALTSGIVSDPKSPDQDHSVSTGSTLLSLVLRAYTDTVQTTSHTELVLDTILVIKLQSLDIFYSENILNLAKLADHHNVSTWSLPKSSHVTMNCLHKNFHSQGDPLWQFKIVRPICVNFKLIDAHWLLVYVYIITFT